MKDRLIWLNSESSCLYLDIWVIRLKEHGVKRRVMWTEHPEKSLQGSSSGKEVAQVVKETELSAMR